MCLILFLNNFKSSKDKTKLLDGKEAEFYKNFSDINDLKIRPHNALISKSGQNAETSGIWLFSKQFRDLLSENDHIIIQLRLSVCVCVCVRLYPIPYVNMAGR